MLVKFTMNSGETVWINPDMVTDVVSDSSGGSMIFGVTNGPEETNMRSVLGTPDEVAARLNGEGKP